MFQILTSILGGAASGLMGDSMGMSDAGSPLFEASEKIGEVAGQGVTMGVATSPIGKAVAGTVMPGATALAGSVSGGEDQKKPSMMDSVGSGAKDFAKGAFDGIVNSDPLLGSMNESFSGSEKNQSSTSKKMGYAVGQGDDEVGLIPFQELMKQNIRR